MAGEAKSGSGGVLGRFAALSTPGKIGVFVVLGGVLFGLYWYLFYGEMADALTSSEATARKLGTEASDLKQRQDDFRKLQSEKKSLEDGLKRNAVALPASAPVPSFVSTLQTQMQVANVKLGNYKPLPEQTVETYIKVPVAFEVRGDYYELLYFFKLLYETRRIVTVEDLSIGKGERAGGQMVLTATFTASTFRQSDAPPPAPGKPGAPAPGGKK